MNYSEDSNSRKKEVWRFETLSDYNDQLKKIFQEDGSPFVIGRYGSIHKSTQAKVLSPLTKLDDLRVRNFCEGVDRLDKYISSDTSLIGGSPNFFATMGVGIGGTLRYDLGGSFFQTGFDLEGISYNLDLFLYGELLTRKLFYQSKSHARLPANSLEIFSFLLGEEFNHLDLEVYGFQ